MVLLMSIPLSFRSGILVFFFHVTKLEGCPHCCSVVAMDSSSPHCCCSVAAMGPSLPPPKHPIFLQRCTPLRVAMDVCPIQDVGVVGAAAAVLGVDWALTEVLVFPPEALVEVATHWVVGADSKVVGVDSKVVGVGSKVVGVGSKVVDVGSMVVTLAMFHALRFLHS